MADQGVHGLNKKLTEAWRVQDLYVEYNDCELEDGDFVDFEQVLGGSSINAQLIFLDNQGFTSAQGKKGTDPRVGGLIKVNWTDVWL